MWIVAGVLLGVTVLAAVAGFHAGPHAHLVSAVAGAAAAVWLVVMLATGDARPLLYVLLGADVTVSAVLGVVAWRALATEPPSTRATRPIEGEMGVAVDDLTPSGIVRVHGEEWSAECVNGTVRRGTPVQVLDVQGVRLRVWGEQADRPGITGGGEGHGSPDGGSAQVAERGREEAGT